MVDAHHLAAAEADEGEERGELTAVRPYIKDTNLRLGGTEWGLDNGYEGDPFLEQIVRALGGGDGGELVVGGGKEDALAGERVERLEDQMVAAGGETGGVFGVRGGRIAEPVVEEDGGRDGGVVEEGDGELADVEIPVGMAGPFDVEGLAVVEGEGDLFADELVDDGAVVNAANGNEAAVVAVGETAVDAWVNFERGRGLRERRCRRCGCRGGRR